MSAKMALIVSLFSFSAFAFNDNVKDSLQSGPFYKYVDEMTPNEVEDALNGVPRCNIQPASKTFPYTVDFVTIKGEGNEPLFFLELSAAGKKKKKILYLEKTDLVLGGYIAKYNGRLLQMGWQAEISVSALSGKGYDVMINNITDGWFGSSAEKLHKFCASN